MSKNELISRFPLFTSRVECQILLVISDLFESNSAFSANAAGKSFKMMESVIRDDQKYIKKMSRVSVCEFSFLCISLVDSENPTAISLAKEATKRLNKILISQLK